MRTPEQRGFESTAGPINETVSHPSLTLASVAYLMPETRGGLQDRGNVSAQGIRRQYYLSFSRNLITAKGRMRRTSNTSRPTSYLPTDTVPSRWAKEGGQAHQPVRGPGTRLELAEPHRNGEPLARPSQLGLRARGTSRIRTRRPPFWFVVRRKW